MGKLTLLAAAALAAVSSPALAVAVVNAPTLHGFCATANPCTDNGTNTPTAVNPPVFGFSAGGHDETGNVFIDILVPNNIAPGSPFTISGPLLGVSTFLAPLFDANGVAPGTPAWTTGDLAAYLGISASPNNPIGAFAAGLGYQPGATGFYVYQANLGTQTLPSNSNASNAFLMQLGQNLAQGSYIVAFMSQPGTNTLGATANSGAILETRTPLPEPSTWALMLFGFGAAGVAMRRSRRKALLPQAA